MNKTLSIIALGTALTIGGTAYADYSKLELEVDRYVNGADLSRLSDAELESLRTVLASSESFSDRQTTIYAMLEDSNALVDVDTTTGATSTFFMSDDQYAALQRDLNRFGDYDVDTMTQTQIMQLMSVVYSSDPMSEKGTKIEAIIQG